ncbi:MAG: hypothetical protein SVR08_05275 [Spirochaetota bacterium]|nr:hypothetical protein [Spirochaetota bacterium]
MIRYLVLLIVIIFSFSHAVTSAIMFDPELEWKTITTEHFYIHFHQGLEQEAKKLTVIAERVHNRLKDLIKWEPYSRTDVILVDNMDMANGFAMPLPDNRIQIYLSRPRPGGVLSNFDNWLENVFTHEYTHILNIDTVNGFAWGMRLVFGRLYFPNVFLPIWLLEGNAVYHESSYSSSGRNNSTYTDMVMRMEVFSDNIKSISEASHFPRSWPLGSVPYLYGGLFVDFLERKYGKGTIADIFIDVSYDFLPYSDHTIPYILPFVRSSADYAFGGFYLTWYHLWNEWKNYLKFKYNLQISKIKDEGVLTNYKNITDTGYETTLPLYSRDGKYIYYVRFTNYNKPVLMRYSTDNQALEKICRINYPTSLSVTENGDLYLSDIEFYRSFSIYYEAFKYDGSYSKVTSRLRGKYIDITSDGKKSVFVKQDRNRYSINISDPKFMEFDRIIENSDIQFAFTRFSADGKKIAFTLKDRIGFADIAYYDTVKKEFFRLTNDKFSDINPTWHPSGERIIFSSDRTGVYNLYELNLQEKTLSRITNVIGGAFSPSISPDGKNIAFSSYSSNGFDISLISYPDAAISSEEIRVEKIDSTYFKAEKDIASNKLQYNDYSIWNTIFPPFWVPFLGSDEVYEDKYQWVLGFLTLGVDTLFQHLYYFSGFISTFEKRAGINLFYNYSGLYPNIFISYEDDTLFFGEDEFPWEDDNIYALKRELTRTGTIGISFPFLGIQSQHFLSFSYKIEKDYLDLYIPMSSDSQIDFTSTLSRLRGTYYYNSSNIYSYSISNEDGRSFFFVADLFDEKLGSDLSFYKFRAEYDEYLPSIFRNNVVMFRLRGGASFHNPEYMNPYNLGRFEKGDTGTPETDEGEFGLRGYPSGLLYGNRIATAAIEYRFPVIQTDFGLATFPIMFRDLWFVPFFEYGNVWNDDNTRLRDFKSSAGAELHLRFTLGYRINLQGYIGYARGFDEYGEEQVYFAISTFFEGALDKRYEWLDYL